MGINGYDSSIANYYAEMARQRNRANPVAEAAENPAVAEFASQGMGQNNQPDPAEQPNNAASAAAGFMAAPNMSGQDLLNMLGSQTVGGSTSGSFENTDTARGSIFNEMLKSFGVAGDHSRAQQYMQETIRNTYGIM